VPQSVLLFVPLHLLIQLPALPLNHLPARRVAVVELPNDRRVLTLATFPVDDLPLMANGVVVDGEAGFGSGHAAFPLTRRKRVRCAAGGGVWWVAKPVPLSGYAYLDPVCAVRRGSPTHSCLWGALAPGVRDARAADGGLRDRARRL